MVKLCSICFGSYLNEDICGASFPENDLNHGNKFSEVSRRFPRFVSSYLNFMRETLNHEMGTDAHFTELEEPVCVDCFSLLESFCRAFRQWEKFHLELSWTLGKISEAINRRQTRNYGTDQQEGAQHGVDNFSVFIDTANKRIKKRLPCVKVSSIDWEPRSSSEKSYFRDDSGSSFQENLIHLDSVSAGPSPIDNLSNPRSPTSPKILVIKEIFSLGDQSENCSDHGAGVMPVGEPIRGKSYKKQRNRHQLLARRELKKHGCLMCSKSFRDMCFLEYHMRTHTQEKPYICKACGKECASGTTYLNHQRKDHNRELERLPKPYGRSVSRGKRFDCIMCPGSFDAFADLAAHLRSHSRERPFFCKECGFESRSSGYRNVHRTSVHFQQESEPEKSQMQLRLNEQKRIFDCLQCGRSCSSKYHLKRHMSTHNPDLLTCSFCKKVFTKRVNLKKHQAVMHAAKDKSFQCSTCGKGFTTKEYLRFHLRIHEKDHKKHMCNFCGKRFADKHHRNLHEKLHRGERSQYQCKLCDKTFPFVTTYRTHVKSHNPENWMQCQFCEKRFVLKATLERHEQTHSSEKSFLCPICGTGFKDKWEMGRHKEIHNEDNTYQCEACDRGFRTKRYLMRHVRKEHKWKLEF